MTAAICRIALLSMIVSAPVNFAAQNTQPLAPTTSTIRFEEIATKSGLHFVTTNSPTPNKNQPETMVAGVALLEYDSDSGSRYPRGTCPEYVFS